MQDYRRIIHVDMDAFYASVEQRNRPELKGLPVIVGGDPDSRGVVAACSYEARKFGIHSAMAASKAKNLCPEAVFLRPDFETYKNVSQQIRSIFYDYTELVEPLSLDEAYLDVSRDCISLSDAGKNAEEIRLKIKEKTGLTASAGVSINKFLAKTASDMNKPDGLTIITPEMVDALISALPVGKFFGIGRVTEKKLHLMGVFDGKGLRNISKDVLIKNFGKAGEYYYEISRGIDSRKVIPLRPRKSAGKETTFESDISDWDIINEELSQLSGQVEKMLKKDGLSGSTVTVKIKYHDFQVSTRALTMLEPTDDAKIIMEYARSLLLRFNPAGKKVRLAGVTVSNLSLKRKKDAIYQSKLPLLSA